MSVRLRAVGVSSTFDTIVGQRCLDTHSSLSVRQRSRPRAAAAAREQMPFLDDVAGQVGVGLLEGVSGTHLSGA